MQSGEPLLVEWRMHPRRVSLSRCPELVCLGLLTPLAETAGVEEDFDECLESLCGRELVAGLPLLNGTQTHRGSLRKLSLYKACPSAVAQKQASEAFDRR